MVGKKITNPNSRATKAARIEGLVNYIVGPERENGSEKCVYFGARGFLTVEFGSQKAEMIALSEEALRSKDPIDHYVLSWREGERPTPRQIEKAMDILLDEFGMDAHQCLYGLHRDTDNFHLHVVLNRTDPLSGRAERINKGFDIEALHRAVARIEHAQGWAREEHGRYEVLDEGVVRSESPEKETVRKPSRIRDAERRTGEKSALSIAQERVPKIAREATSWQDLYGKLAGQGMAYRLRGAGAVLLMGEAPVKPSNVDRKLGLSALEKRWGIFESPTVGIEKKEAPPQEPVNETGKDLGFGEYAKARRLHYAARKEAKDALKRRIEQERKDLFERQREERKKTFAGSWKGRGAELNALRSVLAAIQAGERADLRYRIGTLRKQFSTEYPPCFFPDFEEWVRKNRGKEASERYRHNGKSYDMPMEIRPSAPFEGQDPEPRDIRDYRPEVFGREVRYSNARGQTAFVDFGPKIRVVDPSDASVLAALQLARQKYGKDLIVTGPEAFQEKAIRLAVRNGIPLANPELREKLREERERVAAEREQERPKSQFPGSPRSLFP